MTKLPKEDPNFRCNIELPNPMIFPLTLIPRDIVMSFPGSRFSRKNATPGITPTKGIGYISDRQQDTLNDISR